MPVLNIEDFRFFKDEDFEKKLNEPENKEEISLEKVEEFYKNKIKQLEEKYLAEIEKEREKAYKEGFEKGKKESEEKFKKILKQELEKAISEKEEEYLKTLDRLNSEIKNAVTKLKEAYKKRIDYIDELILSALEEILYYMYIDESNLDFLSREIKKLIYQIKNSSTIKLTIPPSMADLLKDINIEDIEIEIDDKLPKGDFIIEFDDVQLETNFQEKIKILRDEIKREIKKHSKI